VTFKKFIAASLIVVLPVVLVRMVKQTRWGEMRATPSERQKGDPQAKVVIVEFSDFQCPTCAIVQPAIHQYLDTYKGKVRFIYKYFPLVKPHPNAMPAAHAAECASEQKQFWPYHDKLFEKQAQWSKLANATTSFMAIGDELKLDMERFRACFDDPKRRWSIEADMKEARDRQVRATPTFFLGDERLVGHNFMTEGARTIEKVLREKS
jgi:protein-disulfide isomerase